MKISKNGTHNTPLLVANVGWGETVPEWLKSEVQAERMINSMVDLMGKGKDEVESKIGDAEVVVYLMTASLVAPIDREHTNIYLHLAGKVLKRTKRMKEMPDDIKIEKLSQDEEREFKELRQKIYRGRGGDFQHPVISFLKEFKKEVEKPQKTLW